MNPPCLLAVAIPDLLVPFTNFCTFISIGSSMYLYLLQMQLSLTNAVITLTLLFPRRVSS